MGGFVCIVTDRQTDTHTERCSYRGGAHLKILQKLAFRRANARLMLICHFGRVSSPLYAPISFKFSTFILFYFILSYLKMLFYLIKFIFISYNSISIYFPLFKFSFFLFYFILFYVLLSYFIFYLI